MRDLLRRMQPTEFNDIVAVLALYRPGPMGMNAHNDYADRKNDRQADQADPPRARGTAARTSSSETYGLIVYQEQIMFIAQKVASLLDGQGRRAAQGHGQEEARGPRGRVQGLPRGHDGQRVLRGRGEGVVGHHPSVRRLRVQQVARRGLRAGVLLDGLPQGQLPGRVHGGTAHLRRRRQGQGRGLPGRLPPTRASRCCRPTSTSRCRTSPRWAPTSASGWVRSATSARMSLPR